MHILLIYPWYGEVSTVTYEEPLGILYIAAVLEKAGYRVRLADLTRQKNLGVLDAHISWADVACISATTPLFGSATRTLRYIRRLKKNMPLIIGGPHATANPTDALLNGFDVAVLGEGEITVVELMETIATGGPLESVQGIAFPREDKTHLTPPRPFVENLDRLPMPARHFVDYSHYRRLGIISMRGCPNRCLYCKPIQDRLFGVKLRRRSLENVVEEIHQMIGTYGNRPIGFKDDTMTVHNAQWFDRFGELLKRRGLHIQWQCNSRVDRVDIQKLTAMKASGCTQIFFGVESGSQRILDYYRKDTTVARTEAAFAACHEAGIRPCASIMLGAPPETREDLEKTYRLVKKIRPYNWHVHVTTPICGSNLYEKALGEKRFQPQSDYRCYGSTGNLCRLNLPMKLDHLSAGDIAEYRNRINRLMTFRVLCRWITDVKLWRELLTSPAMRVIALNFMRQHFKLTKNLVSVDTERCS